MITAPPPPPPTDPPPHPAQVDDLGKEAPTWPVGVSAEEYWAAKAYEIRKKADTDSFVRRLGAVAELIERGGDFILLLVGLVFTATGLLTSQEVVTVLGAVTGAGGVLTVGRRVVKR
jgi:hypothetical protein